MIDEVSARLKVNFSSLVARFERENINIVEFASNAPLHKKIDIITTKLKEYVNDDIKKRAGAAVGF